MIFDPLKWAEYTVTTYLETSSLPSLPENVPVRWLKPGGTFVCVKKQGQLRGCIGTYMPARPTLVEEIMHNAVGSVVNDPRFLPVTVDELPDLRFSIDVLETPEKAASISELDPKVFGVLVKSGHKCGLLLPDLDGVNTVEEQLAIAARKANIYPWETVEIYRFRVNRYE